MLRDTDTHDHRRRLPNGGGPDALIRVGLVAAFALFAASNLPLPLVAPALRSILLLAAMISAGIAALRFEPPAGARFTHWDDAAVFAALGFLAGFFVDPAAVEALANAR